MIIEPHLNVALRTFLCPNYTLECTNVLKVAIIFYIHTYNNIICVVFGSNIMYYYVYIRVDRTQQTDIQMKCPIDRMCACERHLSSGFFYIIYNVVVLELGHVSKLGGCIHMYEQFILILLKENYIRSNFSPFFNIFQVNEEITFPCICLQK